MKHKKMIAAAGAFCIFLQILFPVYAQVYDHTSGITEYNADISDFESAEYSETDGAKLKGGEKAEYNVFLPFDSNSITIGYETTENTAIKISAEGIISESALFAEENTVDIAFGKVLRSGDCSLEIECGADVNIKSMRFKKVERKTASPGVRNETSFSEYEEALRDAVILNVNSPIIKVDNAKRYTDYSDVTRTPVRIGEKTFLPVNTLARILGYYYEFDKDNGWLLLRNDNFEYVLKNGAAYTKKGSGSYEAAENILNEDMLLVEYFADAAERTTVKIDDYIIIGYKNLVKKIVSGYMDEIKSEFADYIDKNSGGNTYHVSKAENASDSGGGTAENPFATIGKAASVAKAGDTVVIHEGTYRETLRPSSSGEAAKPITFKAADGEKPVISALEPIGEITGSDGNITEYTPGWYLGDGRNQVFYNGKAIAEARHPNSGTAQKDYFNQLNLSSLWPTMGDIRVQKDGIALSDDDLNQPEDYWNGATLISFNGRAWSLAASKVEKSEPGKLTLTDMCERFWFDDESADGDWGFITGTKNAIDVPGEWYWGADKKLYIYLPENINASGLEGKRRQATINLRNRKYINIENIDTIGGGMILNSTEMCVINGGNHKYVGHYTYTKDQQYGYISDANKFSQTGSPMSGELGIYMGGNSDAVINTHIEYSAGSGIYATGKYGLIENNLIEDCGYMGGYMGGIFMTSADGSNTKSSVTKQRGGFGIYNNTVRRAGRSVFEMASTENPWWNTYGMEPFMASEVAYNDFSDSSITARDTGIVYIHGIMLGTDRKRFTFHNNTLWNSWSGYTGNMGIYFDNWSQQGEAYNNIVFYTDKNIPCSEVFVQPNGGFKDSFSSVDEWNNVSLGYLPGGKQSLKTEDFPENRTFASGCNPSFEKNMNNFDVEDSRCSAVSAKLYSAKLHNGAAVMENAESRAEFDGLDFGEDKNAVRITYYGDKYGEAAAFELAVGESYEKSEKRSVNLVSAAACENQLDSYEVVLPVKGGAKNLYITKKGGGIIKISGVEPIKIDAEEYEGYAGGIVYAANYSEAQNTRENFGKLYGGKPTGKKMLVNNTYGGTVLKFDNVYVAEDADYFAFSAGTTAEYSGGIIKVYIDNADGEYICAAEINKESWTDYTPQTVKLNNTLKSGLYTVRIEFCGSNTTSDFWWFSFIEKNDIFAFPECERSLPAVLCSKTNSSEVSTSGNYIGSLNGDTYVVFKDIDFGDDSISEIKVKMGVSPDYAGAEVSIWEVDGYDDLTDISSKNGVLSSSAEAQKIGSFNAASTGGFVNWGNFTAKLSKPLTGKKTVVFTFSKFASGCLKSVAFSAENKISAYNTIEMENADIVKPSGSGWAETYYKQDAENNWCIGEKGAYAVFRDVDFGSVGASSMFFEYAYIAGGSLKTSFAVWVADELADESTVIESVGGGDVYTRTAEGEQIKHQLSDSTSLAFIHAETCTNWKKSTAKTVCTNVTKKLTGKHTIIVVIGDYPSFLYNIRFSEEAIKKYAYTDVLGIQNYERAEGIGISSMQNCFTSLDANEEIVWKNVYFGSGEENLKLKITAAAQKEYAGHAVTVLIDSEKAAEFVLPDTGGWYEFEEFTENVPFKVGGYHDVSVKFHALGTGSLRSVVFERVGYEINRRIENDSIVVSLENNPLSEIGLDISGKEVLCAAVYEKTGTVMKLESVYSKNALADKTEIILDKPTESGSYVIKVFLFEDAQNFAPVTAAAEYTEEF